MPENNKPERNENLRELDTEELVDELVERMKDLPKDQARRFKSECMKYAGYEVRPTYHKPEPEKRNGNGRGFFTNGDKDRDDKDRGGNEYSW